MKPVDRETAEALAWLLGGSWGVRDSDRSATAAKHAKRGSTRRARARAEGIAKGEPQ